MLLLSSADFFLNIFFPKKIRNTIRVSKVGIQIMTDVLSILTWIQTVYKGYPQATKVAVNFLFKINFFKHFFQQRYQSVKRFGSRSGPTFCRS